MGDNMSKIQVDEVVNKSGDGDSGLDLSTNDVVKVNIAGSEKARVHSDGKVGIGETAPLGTLHVKTSDSGASAGSNEDDLVVESSDNTGISILSGTGGSGALTFGDSGDNDIGEIRYDHGDNVMLFVSNTSEVMRCDSNGRLLIGNTAYDSGATGILNNGATGLLFVTADGDAPVKINRLSSDGELVELSQANNKEGSLSVSGSTVSLVGFSGQHESSGIATNTAVGTVVSTIDELDTYASGEKKGQTRTDHAKVKVSDTAGDKAVYGVVDRFNSDDKVIVSAVGIASIKVTGACAKGDLLESNGDGTAKVQSDDIIRSKTIGKVTIGNSNTDEKLVSCVLYCG